MSSPPAPGADGEPHLSEGDEIRLGQLTLTFRIEAPQAPTETVANEPGNESGAEP
jgi:hypothetical protein